MSRLRSAFTGDIRDALVNLGLPETRSIQKDFGSYIDQDTITKAIGNKYSAASPDRHSRSGERRRTRQRPWRHAARFARARRQTG